MIKVIFLDFDGVVNNQTGEWKNMDIEGFIGGAPHDPENIKVLNTLLEKCPEAKLVISSTWRLGTDIETLQRVCDTLGIKGEVIGKTESFHGQGSVRGNEIRFFIDENKELLGYDRTWNYKNYVILDDDSDMLYPQRHNFVHVDNEVGLTYGDVNKALAILNKEYKDDSGFFESE